MVITTGNGNSAYFKEIFMSNNQLVVAPSEGGVALNLMVEQAANSDLTKFTMPQAVIMVATQALLDRATDDASARLRVIGARKSTHHGADEMWCVQGRGKRKIGLVVPSIQRHYKTSILSVLRVTAPSGQCKLQLNGMPGAGLAAVSRWGDSGECEIRWPQAWVSDYLTAIKFETMGAENKANMAATYGETPTLVVEGERIALPSIAQCGYVARALAGEHVVCSSRDLDAIEPFMACGLPLVSGPNPNQVGILDAYTLQLPPARA